MCLIKAFPWGSAPIMFLIKKKKSLANTLTSGEASSVPPQKADFHGNFQNLVFQPWIVKAIVFFSGSQSWDPGEFGE